MINEQQRELIERVGDGLLHVAEQREKAIDEELKKLENLDEDDFEALRQKRRINLQKQMRQDQDWRQLGHGVYSELTDTKEFFNAAKTSPRIAVHFYRSVTPRCQIVDAHFEKLAATHLEARFVKIDAEKNPFLVEKLGVILMPTIVLIKDGKTDHAIHGFDEFGGTDDFSTTDVEYVLSTYDIIKFDGDRSENIANSANRSGGVNNIRITSVKASRYALDDPDDDFDT